MNRQPLWEQMVQARWGSGPGARTASLVFLALALALGIFQLHTALFLSLDAFLQRVIHLMFVLTIVFLVVPASSAPWARHRFMWAVDGLFMVAAIVVSLYLYIYYDDITWRIGMPTRTDIVLGTVALVVLLEATRRVVGRGMMLIVLAFILYTYLGPYLPGLLNHRGFSHQRMVYHLYMFQEGIYGLPLGVAATFVFTFIFFGGLLEKTGAGQFLIDMAFSLVGRYRGGPAKGAVLASGLFGSISGSAIANTVTTGAFTIPLMRRVGYQPHEAAGIEAAASTGGQILPPVMGAGAFVMAELLGMPYIDVVKVSILPALMYFIVVYFFVDTLARRYGIEGLRPEEVPDWRKTLARGFHFLLPMAYLVYLLFQYYTPMRAALYALGLLLIVSLLRPSSRMTLMDALEVFTLAAKNTLTVSIATAAAGVVVGIVGLTGLGLKFSSLMLSFSGDHLLLAILLVAVASLVLGMGLPVTASYVVLAVLAAPALVELGLSLLTAHIIVYWYSQDSNVTPPVALAAFAGAGIAQANPMKTAVAAWKYAKGLYIIPILMAYSPLLLQGSVWEVAEAVISGILCLVAFAIALEGYLLRQTSWWERGLSALAALSFIVPRLGLHVLGLALLMAVVWLQSRPAPPTAAGTTAG